MPASATSTSQLHVFHPLTAARTYHEDAARRGGSGLRVSVPGSADCCWRLRRRFLCATRLLAAWVVLPFMYLCSIGANFFASYLIVLDEIKDVSQGGYFLPNAPALHASAFGAVPHPISQRVPC